MKKYRVNVNGTQYDITLEVLEGEAAAAAPKAAPAAAPAAPAAKAPAGAPGHQRPHARHHPGGQCKARPGR